MKTIIWIGDSINHQNPWTTYPQTGIAQAFDRYVEWDVVIWDRAENGRSTKSYLDEGWFEPVREELKAGDFLFIQFAHNDEKKADPNRYTEPETTFTENLKIFIDAALDRGAHPVLLTPAERCLFDEEGNLSETGHAPYAKAILAAGRKFGVPVIDLWSKSRAFLEKEGPKAARYYMHLEPEEAVWCPEGQKDSSHLKYEGAFLYGGMVAEELQKLGGIYADLIWTPEKEKDPFANLQGKEL